MDTVKRSLVHRNSLPEFIEEVLGKAIFAFTATRKYEAQEIEDAYEAWLPRLERALTDQLYRRTPSITPTS